MDILFTITLALMSALLCTVMGLKLTQILQQSSYRAKGLFTWFRISRFNYVLRYFSLSFFSVASMLMFVACFRNYKYVVYFGLLFYMILSIIFIFNAKSSEHEKIPLQFTPRAIRFTVLEFILNSAVSFALVYFGMKTWLLYSLVGLAPFALIFTTLLSHFIMLPFENLNNRRYLNAAVKKLNSMPNLIRIGITGSYGKTTAKHILAKMLEKKYNVCYSPASYNTPMGLSRVINDTLNFEHRIFIAEMGARNRGDIAQLADVIKPDYAIITAIGNQHFETFGSVQNIIDTKYELIDSLSKDGHAVFNGDNEYVKQMYEKAECKKSLVSADAETATASYSDVEISTEGTRFVMNINGEKKQVNTVLLGKHIPSVITVCAECAAKLGVDLSDIADAVSDLEPIAHRLQLIRQGSNVILDDAYNSNSEGAKNALEILKQFDMTRIVITPGMVELGTLEKDLNTEFGKQIAKNADYCYLIGSRAAFIANGAESNGMSSDRIKICQTLDQAVNLSAQLDGDKAILFENDLPDNL